MLHSLVAIEFCFEIAVTHGATTIAESTLNGQ
jgi:hypothetical protein